MAVRARRGPPPPLCAGTAARRRTWATAQSETDVTPQKPLVTRPFMFHPVADVYLPHDLTRE
ncbi:hypothetical protein GCM10018789_21810 [Streptomyces werraensis]|nr:hypothetical protein GCM10018789_21810 [Streptomyces werraensis]